MINTRRTKINKVESNECEGSEKDEYQHDGGEETSDGKRANGQVQPNDGCNPSQLELELYDEEQGPDKKQSDQKEPDQKEDEKVEPEKKEDEKKEDHGQPFDQVQEINDIIIIICLFIFGSFGIRDSDLKDGDSLVCMALASGLFFDWVMARTITWGRLFSAALSQLVSAVISIWLGKLILDLSREAKPFVEADEFGAIMIIMEGTFDLLNCFGLIGFGLALEKKSMEEDKIKFGIDQMQIALTTIKCMIEVAGALCIIAFGLNEQQAKKGLGLAMLMWILGSDALSDQTVQQQRLIHQVNKEISKFYATSYAVQQFTFIGIIVLAVVKLNTYFDEFNLPIMGSAIIVACNNFFQLVSIFFDEGQEFKVVPFIMTIYDTMLINGYQIIGYIVVPLYVLEPGQSRWATYFTIQGIGLAMYVPLFLLKIFFLYVVNKLLDTGCFSEERARQWRKDFWETDYAKTDIGQKTLECIGMKKP